MDDDHIERHDDGPSTSFSHEVEVTFGDTEATIYVYLDCTAPSEAPSGLYGPPEFYDPGGPAEFELDYAEVEVLTEGGGKSETIKLSKLWFWILLGDKAQLAYDSAVEAAQESGEF